MKFYIFMKCWSLVWWSLCLGAAIGAIVRKDWLYAMFYVAGCAINHFCYSYWSESLKK